MASSILEICVHQQAPVALIDQCMDVMRVAFDPLYGEAWTAAQTTGMLALPGVRLITGHEGVQMLGFGLIRAIAGEAELLLLAVRPDARRRGVGLTILHRCMNVARALDARTMFLEVREGNDAAYLYRKADFQHYNSRRDYYLGGDGKRRTALSFRHTLD